MQLTTREIQHSEPFDSDVFHADMERIESEEQLIAAADARDGSPEAEAYFRSLDGAQAIIDREQAARLEHAAVMTAMYGDSDINW